MHSEVVICDRVPPSGGAFLDPVHVISPHGVWWYWLPTDIAEGMKHREIVPLCVTVEVAVGWRSEYKSQPLGHTSSL